MSLVQLGHTNHHNLGHTIRPTQLRPTQLRHDWSRSLSRSNEPAQEESFPESVLQPDLEVGQKESGAMLAPDSLLLWNCGILRYAPTDSDTRSSTAVQFLAVRAACACLWKAKPAISGR